MIEKFFKIVSPNFESTIIYYTIPTVAALIGIILLWIIFLVFSQFVKLKSEKWKDIKCHSNIAKRLVVTQKSLILKTLTSFRIIFTLYFLILLVSHVLEVFSVEIKDSIKTSSNNMEKLWSTFSNYSHKGSHLLDTFSSFMLNIFLIIIIAIWVYRILQKTLDLIINKPSKLNVSTESLRSIAKKNTAKSMANNILKVLIMCIAILCILQSMGVNIAALLATAGLASVAISFGAQSLVKDFIAGFFILFEDQFTHGDSVEINTSTGQFGGSIEKMTLRMLRLRSTEGSIICIPNGDIKSIKNFSTDWARIDFKYGLDVQFSMIKASQIFKEEVEKLHKEFSSEIIGEPDIRPMEKIVDFEGKAPSVTFRFFMKTINSAAKTKIEMEFNRRLITRFNEENIFGK